jgi:excisionase family DNA binding protein
VTRPAFRSGACFTTTQAALLLGLSPNKVRRLIDAGALKAAVVPGQRLRRVYRRDLEPFAREHGIALPGLCFLPEGGGQ